LTVRFGDCAFDPEAHELIRDGRSAPLSPKAFRLLGILITGRPRAITQADLRDALWPGTHVARTSLARLVTEIRRATGDDARAPRYVRNVHGFGYAFCGQVDGDSPKAAPKPADGACALLWGESVFRLLEGENVIGRAPESRLPIESPAVSRRHARVFVAGGQATIEDLGSKNGTFLGGRRLERPTRLEDGATVIVGPALLVFRGAAGRDSTKTGSSAPP
jgi:DNA-binding winged helix-turn-helix (wHTH) protein